MRNLIFLGACVTLVLLGRAAADAGQITDEVGALIIVALLVAALSVPRWLDGLVLRRGFWLTVLVFVLFAFIVTTGVFTTGYDDARRANNWNWIVTGDGTYQQK